MKNTLKIIISLIILTSITACSSSKSTMSAIDTYSYNGSADSLTSYESSTSYDEDSKIIINSDITIQTKEFDKTNTNLKELVNSFEGYIQSSSIYNHENGNNAYYTIRIPADSFDDFVNGTNDIGYVSSINTSIDDITDSYYDISARIDSLIAQRTSLEAMYAKCTTIEELISVESRLSEVQYQIDSYQSQINNYDLLTKYSTINVSIIEVKDITTPSNSFIDDIKNAFVDSFKVFTNFVQNFIITLIYLLPFIIVLIIIIYIIRKTKILNKIHFRKKKKDN